MWDEACLLQLQYFGTCCNVCIEKRALGKFVLIGCDLCAARVCSGFISVSGQPVRW